MIRRLGLLTLALATVLLGQAHAQSNATGYSRNLLSQLSTQNSASGYSAQRNRNMIYRNAVPQYNYTGVGKNVLNPITGSPATPAQKPFANRSSGPSVSPYLGLTSPYTSSAANYYTLVRPQLEQQRINERNEAQQVQMQHQLNSLAARAPYELRGESDQMPTGHQTVYMNFLGYYPQPQGQRR